MADIEKKPDEVIEKKPDEGGQTPPDEGKKDNKTDETVPLATMLQYKKEAKESAEKLAIYEAEAKKAHEEALAKKGEYKTLAETKTAELEKVKADFEKANSQLEVFNKGINDRVEKFVSSITDEEDKTMIDAILEGKTAGERANLLPSLEKKFGTPSDINKGVNGSGVQPPKANEVQVSELQKKVEEAIKAGKPIDVLKLNSQIRALQK